MWAGQDYLALRTLCLKKGELFVDPLFPEDISDPGVAWKRPPEFCSNPVFIENGASTTDICQGDLGDCWLLSAITSLTLYPSLFSRVVPNDQSFSLSDGYCGIFHFRVNISVLWRVDGGHLGFHMGDTLSIDPEIRAKQPEQDNVLQISGELWHYGEWLDVVIDDRLPMKDGRLMYTKSDTREELWSALLEKAYAKVRGNYRALQGGTIPEALEDFTGGVAETVSLWRQTPEEVWDMILQSENMKSLMACYIQASEPGDIGRVNEDRLVLGHAYSVIGAKKVTHGSGEATLVRLRNPWGFTEYTGPWSDKSSEWESVSEEEQIAWNLRKEDGEFWMLCEDFCSLFSMIVTCRVDLDAHCTATHLRGRWESGVNAGGGRRLRSFFTNPQFRIRVGGASAEEVELGTAEERWTVLVELMQTDGRTDKLHIACHLYKVPKEQVSRPRLDRGFFTRSRPVCDTGDPQNSRGVTMRASVAPGHYVIVPSTYDPNQEGDFYIRVYCERRTE